MKNLLFLFSIVFLTLGGSIQADVEQNSPKENVQTNSLESHSNLPGEQYGIIGELLTIFECKLPGRKPSYC